jgi:hypothetical protein
MNAFKYELYNSKPQIAGNYCELTAKHYAAE